MKYSENYEFSLPYKADNDPADIDLLSENFKLIDEILKRHEGFLGNNAKVLDENEVTLETLPSEIPAGVTYCFVNKSNFVDGVWQVGLLVNYNSNRETDAYKIFQVWYGQLESSPMQRKSQLSSGSLVWVKFEKYVIKSDLTTEVETALSEAKESGEFDGTSVTVQSVTESTADGGENIVTFSDGQTLKVKNGSKGSQGIQGEQGKQGIQGEKGEQGEKGDSYILSEADKQEIAQNATSVCVAKNQGSANVGKILVVGTDGNFTLIDMPECGASGDVVGVLDEANNILLSGNLADGTYTLKYENADGTYTEIGTLEVGAIPEPVEPVTENITLTDGIRVGSDGGDRTQAGCCATPMIDLTNIPKPCVINLTKALWCNGAKSSAYVRVYAKKADGTQLISRTTEEGMAENYFNVVCNNGNQGDVTVTVLSDEVGYIRFSATWTASAGGADSTTSFAEAGTKATLTYTPNA